VVVETTNLMYRLNVQVTVHGRQTVPDRGVVRSFDPLKNFGSSNHITGTAEPKVVKFCTQVGYINFSNMVTYHQQKGRGYGHVTVLKLCRFSWCSASRGYRPRRKHNLPSPSAGDVISCNSDQSLLILYYIWRRMCVDNICWVQYVFQMSEKTQAERKVNG